MRGGGRCPDMVLQKLQEEAKSWLEREAAGGTGSAAAAVGEGQPGEQQAGAGESVTKISSWTVTRADAKADRTEGAEGAGKDGASWSLQGLLRSTWTKQRRSVDGVREEGSEARARGGKGGAPGGAGQLWRPRAVNASRSGGDWLNLKEGELWHFFVGREDEERGSDGLGGARLMEAATRGLLNVVMWFVHASWAEATYVAPDGRTPLHAACKGRHFDVASFLLAMGADPGAVDNEGRRCLSIACASGDAGLARLVAGACSEDDVVAATDDLLNLVMESDSETGEATEAVLEVWRRWSGSEALLEALRGQPDIELALIDAAHSSRPDLRNAANHLVTALGQRGRMCLLLLRASEMCASAPLSCIDELVETTTQLELAGSHTTQVLESVGMLTNLTQLAVVDTVVQRLPEELAHCSLLRKLTVRCGCLAALPAGIADLQELTSLDVSSNVLQALPPSISRIVKLTHVDLSRNRLKELPPGFGALHSLCQLAVEDNLLCEWPRDFSSCTSLTRLDAGGNVSLGLPHAAGQLHSLRVLSLAGNKLTALLKSGSDSQTQTDTTSLPENSLRELNLSHNCFTRIPEAVVRCRQLERLWLSHNELRELPSTLAQTRGLRTLHVDHNHITLLPPSLSRTALMSTYDLRVEGNDMRHPMRLDSKLDCEVEELLGYCASLERGRERVMQATVVVDGPSKLHTKMSVMDSFLSAGAAKRDAGQSFQALRTWVSDMGRKEDGAKLEPVVVEHSRLCHAVEGECVELQFMAVSGSRDGGHEVMRDELVPGRSVLCFVWETRTPLFDVLASAKEALGRFLRGSKKRSGWTSDMSVVLVCVAAPPRVSGSAADSQPAEVLRFFSEHADASAPAAPARRTRGAAAAAAFDAICNTGSSATIIADASTAKFRIKGFLTVDASLKHCAWVPTPGQQGGVRGVKAGEVLDRFAMLGRDAAVGDFAFPEAMAPQGLTNAVEIVGELAERQIEKAMGSREEGTDSAYERLVPLAVLKSVVQDQSGLLWDEYGSEVMTILQSKGTALMLGGAQPTSPSADGSVQSDDDRMVLLGTEWVGLAAGLVLGLGMMSKVQEWSVLVKAGRELLRTAGWSAESLLKKESERKLVDSCVQRLEGADPAGGMLCKGVLLEEVGEALFGSANRTNRSGGVWGVGMPGWELVGSVLSSFGVLIREEMSKTFLVPSLCTNSIPYPLEWVRSTGAEGRREWIAWRRVEVVGEGRKHACFQVLARLVRNGQARLVLWRDGGLLTMQGGKLMVDGGSEVGVLWLRGAGDEGVAEQLVQTGLDEMRSLGLAAEELEAEPSNSSDAQAELSLAAHLAAKELDDAEVSDPGETAEKAEDAVEKQQEDDSVCQEEVEAGDGDDGNDAGGAQCDGDAAKHVDFGEEGGREALMEAEQAANREMLAKEEGAALLGALEDGPSLDLGPGPHPAGCGPTEQASPA